MLQLYQGSLRTTTPDQLPTYSRKKQITQDPQKKYIPSIQLSNNQTKLQGELSVIQNQQKKHQFNHLNKYNNADSSNYVFREDPKTFKKIVSGPKEQIAPGFVPLHEHDTIYKKRKSPFQQRSQAVNDLIKGEGNQVNEKLKQRQIQTNDQLCSFAKIFNNDCSQQCLQKRTKSQMDERKHIVTQSADDNLWNLMKQNWPDQSTTRPIKSDQNEQKKQKEDQEPLNKDRTKSNYFVKQTKKGGQE